MERYRPAFSIEVEHTFYAKPAWRDVEFKLTEGSASLVKDSDLLVRNFANGVRVYEPLSSGAGASGVTEGNGDSRVLGFRAHCRDPRHLNFTASVDWAQESIPVLESEDAVTEEDGRWRLHGEYSVSEADWQSADSPRLLDAGAAEGGVSLPLFVVFVGLDSGTLRSGSDDGIRYLVRFAARATHWRYHLYGRFRRDGLYIVDGAREVEFVPEGEQKLADDRTALVYVSETPLPLHDKCQRQFQLREESPGGDRVLIRRLPVANNRQVYKDMFNGTEVLVSKIFINC